MAFDHKPCLPLSFMLFKMQTLFLLSSFLIVVSFASAESGKAAFRKAAGVVRDQPPHYESSESRHVSTYGKRQSSPYLNNVTQSEAILPAFFRGTMS